MGRHVIVVAGSRVVIEDGAIKSISEPKTHSCPLRSKLYEVERETVDSVRRTVEFYIRKWGMFTPHRVVRTESMPVSFGVSEILASGLKHGLLDAVVSVCEGAGTVISSEPSVVQAIGAHMTGLVKTSPEPSIIQKLVNSGAEVLSAQDALMDQVLGVRRAIEAGHSRIGVTITGLKSSDGPRIREECSGHVCAIASVHNTGMSRRAARQVSSSCDVVTSCASRWTREIVAKRAVMQVGFRIPVFILTNLGKELALARLREFPEPLIIGTGAIPRLSKDQPSPLR